MSDENRLEPRPIPEGFTVDVSEWVMGDHFEWDRAATEGDRDKLIEMMCDAIKAWPYNADPSVALHYKTKLKPKQWIEATKAVGNSCYNCFLT